MKTTEKITLLPQSEHFIIGSNAAVNLKYIQYISYELISVSAGVVLAVTPNGKIVLDYCLDSDEMIEKFKSYLKQIELMTTINYIIQEEKK